MTTYGRRRIPGPIDDIGIEKYVSGGAVSVVNGYRTHVITSSSVLTASRRLEVEVAIVSGGGGGGGAGPGDTVGAGGGGAGALSIFTAELYGSNLIVIGSGGLGAPDSTSGGVGENGQSSSALGVTVVGGGGGSHSGLSGSGASSGGSHLGGSIGTASNGNIGKRPISGLNGGGGGGGFSSPGFYGTSTIKGGAGGQGIVLDWIGYDTIVCAGGGGGAYSGAGALGGVSESGGDGANGTIATYREAQPGLPNSGGGGGGGSLRSGCKSGAHGGSGIVIVRYLV